MHVCRICFLGSDGIGVSSIIKVCLRPLFICSLFLQLQLLRNLFASVNSLQPFLYIIFSQNCFFGSFGISLSMGRDTGRGKVAYSWISPDPTKTGPTLGVVVVVVVVVFLINLAKL